MPPRDTTVEAELREQLDAERVKRVDAERERDEVKAELKSVREWIRRTLS